MKPIRPARLPRYNAQDITVVLPTLGTDDEDFRRCLRSINICSPNAVVLVTPKPDIVRKVCEDLDLLHFDVLAAPEANKRLQMIQGIEHVKTPITVFADDDVFWPETCLVYLLAAFEDHSVGAVGPSISLERPDDGNVWDFLSAAYLERWRFGICATSHIDGGLACLSGRTYAIRSYIVQDEIFRAECANEKWLFDIPLSKADDDNFVTRWLVNHGWKIKIQNAPEARVTTTLDNSSAFIGQCIRWCRTTWRSNITSMFFERRIWRDQPWCSYALHLSTLNPPAAVFDSLLAYSLFHAYDNGQPSVWFPTTRCSALTLLTVWIFFTKTVKLWPNFAHHPDDLKFLPASIAFSYFHGLIKTYSMLTLHKTNWAGGRGSLGTGLRDVASSIAAGAKESGSTILRKSRYEKPLVHDKSTKDLRRLIMHSDK